MRIYVDDKLIYDGAGAVRVAGQDKPSGASNSFVANACVGQTISMINGRMYINGREAIAPSAVAINVRIEGDVHGDVTVTGSLRCGKVDGSIVATGSVVCGDVAGGVRSVGPITCDSIDQRTNR